MTQTILVVDDDDDVRDGFCSLLDDEGYQAIGLPNGRAALDHLRTMDPLPCLIFLDLVMPVMDGVTFRREQLKDPRLRAIPVVVVSATPFRNEVPVNRVIRKPFHAAEVLATIDPSW